MVCGWEYKFDQNVVKRTPWLPQNTSFTHSPCGRAFRSSVSSSQLRRGERWHIGIKNRVLRNGGKHGLKLVLFESGDRPPATRAFFSFAL